MFNRIRNPVNKYNLEFARATIHNRFLIFKRGFRLELESAALHYANELLVRMSRETYLSKTLANLLNMQQQYE